MIKTVIPSECYRLTKKIFLSIEDFLLQCDLYIKSITNFITYKLNLIKTNVELK